MMLYKGSVHPVPALPLPLPHPTFSGHCKLFGSLHLIPSEDFDIDHVVWLTAFNHALQISMNVPAAPALMELRV